MHVKRPTPTSTHAADARRDAIVRVLAAILGLNVVVALAKMIYGYRAGVLSITADGLHSLLDASSNVIGLIGIAVARRPPDANHPYGHRKYETFAALGIVAMMFYGCAEILSQAIERWRHPRVPELSWWGVAVLIGTLLINLIVVWIERREGQRLDSELLLADAEHTRSDVFASLLVLGSFAAIRLGVAWADVAAALAIVVLVLRAGFRILRQTLSTLSDERRIDPRLVEEAARAEPGVLEAHNVRSRGPGDDIHLDLHILVNPAMPIAEAHELGHRVETRLRARWPGVTDVIVHVEPALEQERGHPGEGGGLQARG